MKPVYNAFRNGNWVRDSEHVVLRAVSLIFSVGSAYAIRWFFEPLDTGDPIHYVLWWGVAGGFGLLGFYLSRSLMYRMMAKESIWAYVPVFVLVEFFEVLCNYAKAVTAVSSGSVPWVVHAPSGQQLGMALLTYVGWSIIPLVSPTMAVADMDMTRRRNGGVVAPAPAVLRPVSQAPKGGAVPPLQPLPPRTTYGAGQAPRGNQSGSYQAQAPRGQQNGANPPPGVKTEA